MFHFPTQAKTAATAALQSRVKHVLVGGQEAPKMADSPHVIVERQGPIVIVTMNRPEVRNAFDGETLCRMADAWDLIDGDAEVRAAILTGAGGHFCAGSDLKWMASAARGEDEWTARF